MTEPNIYKKEEVEEGGKARWPYETDYEEPTKLGYIFEGWEFKGTVLVPPFEDETKNPFGPIDSDTDIKAKWDKLTIHADTNHTLISGDGDTDSDLTKLSYWVSSDKGKMITSGVTIQNEPLDEDMLPIVFDGSGSTAIVDNKNVKTVKVKENDVNKSRYYRFKSIYSTLESETIEIEQVGKDQTILPDFDFLTFTYSWEDDDGRDLDTATFIIGSKIAIGTDGKTLADYPVGFGCRGSDFIDPDYNSSGTSSNPELFSQVSQYIKGGGDNIASGKESALINWKEICNRDFITQGITKLYCELYANWYITRGNGNCRVSFQTYKTESGTGGMKLDRNEAGKTLYTFSPTGDTTLKNTTNISGNVYASCLINETQRYSSPTGNESGYYSHVATLIYDVKTKNAVLYNKMTSASGRNLRFNCTVNGENNNVDGSISYTYNDYHEYDDLFTKTFTFDTMQLYLNGTANNVVIKYTDDEIRSMMKWYKGDSGWLDLVSATRDSDGNITSLTFRANSINTSTEQREMDIQLTTSKVDTVTCNVMLQIFQKVNS